MEDSDQDTWSTSTQFLPPLSRAAQDSEPESDEDNYDDDDEREEEGDRRREGRGRYLADDDDGELEKRSYWVAGGSVM